MAMTLTREQSVEQTKLAVIDCDIHNYLPSEKVLLPYMSERWRRYQDTWGPRGFTGLYYPLGNQNAARSDAWPPNGKPPGSDLPFMQEQLINRYDLQYGVLFPLLGIGKQLNAEYGAVRARAANDWQIAEWLDPDPRLRASIAVQFEDGDLAAAEIDRVAPDRRFIQVLLEARTHTPLGNRKYWKMYEAAVRHDLPVGIHFGAHGGWPITGVGHPSYYIEYHTGQSMAFQDQLISFIYEGVFERFPSLKVVLIEGGFAWLAPLMWRMDRAWKKLKDEVPTLKRLPSEYIRDHFWFTTQPVEEPPRQEDWIDLMGDLGMDDKIMFATDYPHWDFDSPEEAIPTSLPLELREKIFSGNARALYHL